MRLPWDRNYFKLCFYAVATFIMCCIAKKITDGIFYTFTNIGEVFGTGIRLLSKFVSLFSVAISGFVIAYILDPVVEYLQKKYCIVTGKKTSDTRTAGTVTVYIILLLVIVVPGSIFFSRINGLGGIISSVQGYVNELSQMYGRLTETAARYDTSGVLSDIINNISRAVVDFTGNLGKSAVSVVTAVCSRFAVFCISLVVAFYFLKDKREIQQGLRTAAEAVLSKKTMAKTDNVLSVLHNIFSGYIRGQLTDAFVMSVLITSGLSIINVRFSLVIGIISGFSNIIPYFGAIIGFCLAVFMALAEGNTAKAVYAAVVMVLLQQVDTVLIVPKIVGENVKLSPVSVIISLAVAGRLFGIVGMIFAVPFTAVLKICLENYIDKKVRER